MRRLRLYGLMAEFNNPTDLVQAAHRVKEAGYTKVDAFTPFPMEELQEAIGFKASRLPMLVLLGGILGCLGGFLMQYHASVHAYPLNIGGKPLNSWPAFIPVTFELTILVAALTAVLGMLALNGLPMPNHPVFNAPGFALATRDRFFLCIEAGDPRFELEEAKHLLGSLNSLKVSEVEYDV